MLDKPLVSVYCLTYNHEKYIRDTLEGFINQKTDFSFEVFVHDDASSDNTPMIIKEYASNHPDIIKPIFQSENQYSKGVKITKTYIVPNINGKYIASCEGDDYWSDVNKLQIQVNFLESHPNYVACVHDTLKINKKNNSIDNFFNLKEDCDLKTEDIISRSESGFFHFNSILYRSEYLINERPEFFSKTPGVGDYPLAIYLALNGKIRYVNRVMSIYRVSVPGSWTDRNKKKSLNEIITHKSNIIEMLKSVDIYSRYKYNKTIEKLVNKEQYEILVLKGDYDSIKNNSKMYNIHRIKSRKDKIKVYLKCKLNFLYKVFRRLRYF